MQVDPWRPPSQKIEKRENNLSETIGTEAPTNARQSEVTTEILDHILGSEVPPPTAQPVVHIELTQPQKQLMRKLVAQAMVLRKQRKQFFKLRAKAVKRRKAFKEIYATEASYLKDLILIESKLKRPLMEQKLLTPQDAKKVFSNIESLVSLHTEVEAGFRSRWDNYHFYMCLGEFLQQVSRFYLVYIEFNDAFQKQGYSILVELCKTNQQAKQIVEAFQAESHNDVISCMYKLVKRPGSLNLLILALMKQTEKQHPDHKLLEDALAKFKNIAKAVDDTIGVIIMSKRMQELDQKFPDPNDPIITPKRKMVTEQANLWWVKGDKNIPVTGIFFNDMILLISRQEAEQRILNKLKWTKTSTYANIEDGKTRKNIINLVGQNGTITLTTGDEDYKSKQAKQKLIQQIESHMIDKNRAERVQVKALGTEQLNSTSLSKHTIYIMEVKIGEIRQNLYLRFKEVIELTQNLQKKYPEMKFPSLTKKWLTNHKSSTIETRKIMILETLQTMLNDPNVIENPTSVINALRLRENFYQLPKIIRERYGKQRQSNEAERQSGSQVKKEVTLLDILCATELNLGRYTFHGDEFRSKRIKGDEAMLQVRLSGGDKRNIRIGEFDTVEDVCNKISLNVSLTVNRDFRLFHEIGKKQSRALDHDQIVMKMFDFSKKDVGGFFSKIKNGLTDLIVPDSKPVLVFKKYYYLPFQKEQQQFRKNMVRLNLLTQQVFAEVKDLKYQLTIDEYAFFGASMLYIQNQGDVKNILETKNFDLGGLIDRIIPDLIYKYENISTDKWKQKVLAPLAKLDKEITTLRDANFKKLAQHAKPTDKNDNYTKKDIMCMQIVMNKIKSNPLYGSNMFYIQPHDSTAQVLKNKGVEMAHNMWLSISVQSIALLKPSSKECVFKINYNEIDNKIVYPSSVTFILMNQAEYRFNTCQSFEISQLVEYNKKLIQTMEDLEKCSNGERTQLMDKTSFYVSEITGYRDSMK